jgi:radical SAM superfamily enzyme YgiQ (UPF0313 family)
MRICFVYPGYQKHSDSNPELKDVVTSGSYLGSPTSSIALLAALTPDHHEISFYDDRIEELPFGEQFDLVAMPVFTAASMRSMEIADTFRKTGAKVVTGGIFSSLMPDEMAPHVDAVCIGEGEPVWAQILEDAEKNQLKPRYQADGQVDLREIPVPRWDLYFAKEGPNGYRTTGKQSEATVDYALQLSRGCPLRCMSCVIPEYMGRKMRFVSSEWVRKSFEALSADGKKRYVSLAEDTHTFPARRVYEHYMDVLSESANIGPSISYAGASPTQARVARPEYYQRLREHNAMSIYMVFGFDQASQRAFQADTDAKAWQECLDGVKRVFDEGLEVYASLLVGHDNEDEGVFDKVLEFTAEANIQTAEFVILTPYPGTPLWRRLTEQDRLLTRDFSLYNDSNPTFRPKGYSADQLRAGYLHMWKSFYSDSDRARHHIQV